jgi:hypothetical protein
MSLAGDLKHRLYRLPLRKLRKLRGWGLRGYFLESSWRGEMEAAAMRLQARGAGQEARGDKLECNEPVEVHLLVGKGFWFMAAFAVASLRQQLQRPLHVWFYDDGTLEERQGQALLRLADRTALISATEQEERMVLCLPETRFPHIRRRLLDYPNLKKLTSPHLGSKGAKVVIDADVLFFARPVEIETWLGNPASILCATDCAESYGYPRPLLEEITGAQLPQAINVGITGLVSEEIDWGLLESWCHQLITRHGMSYYLEQALVAMLCAKRPFTQLAADAYITGPSEQQVAEGAGVMQHYVEYSKKAFLEHAWRRFAAEH